MRPQSSLLLVRSLPTSHRMGYEAREGVCHPGTSPGIVVREFTDTIRRTEESEDSVESRWPEISQEDTDSVGFNQKGLLTMVAH